ncbi:MAG TPA: hypothetical protein VKC51_11205, partial [Lacunisphaera sp.]|nr:hypothetical protein [Lacunisphaera sp.]
MVLVALITLAPWWRNHHYLRDFYDYGLVMSGVGRIEAGERPFVDFVTPIQSGTFLFNGWAEKLGDGTYQAMTWGAAALVVLGMTVLAGIFLRCWPAGTAVAMAGAMACMTVAQHTIIWHNCVGAICIAVAACTAAVAPVWRRSQWAWHGLTVVALVIGGITKLNAHLVAVCGVLAWALLHGFTRKADWSRVGATVIGLAICGLLIPVGLELAWTHASPGALWYNVVALPFSGRTGDLTAALHWKFYFSTRHDYYGLLPVPQLGAVGVAVTAAFVVAGIRALGWRQGGWVIAAALFAAASGAGLLATNYEIAYVAMGAWFALVASLWLGFGLRCSGRLFYGGLFFPALAVGAIAWQSAWQGQRSQFGYSQAPRTDYVAGENIAPDFAYLRDTFVPPEISASMSGAARWRAGLSAEEKAAVYYGPGLEWLQRPWPALKIPGLPLWLHGGTSYGAVEEARLLDAFAPAGPYRHVLVPEARDVWGPVITPELAEKYILRRVGPAWFRYDKQPPGVVSWQPLEFLRAFGGNVNSTQLISFELKLQTLFAGRSFLGVDHGAGEMMLTAPSNRAQGEAVVCRVPGKTAPVAAKVRFEVFSVAGGNYYPRWSAEVNLPEAQSEIIVPFPVDCGGSPLRFLVTVPPELAGRVVAGWRDLNVLHSVDGPEVPPMLQMWARDAEPANAAMRAAVLPADWNPSAMYVRNARLGPRGLELLPGGEIWIKLAGIFVGINGVASVAEGVGMPVDPVMHVLYCKGAKLDVVAESAIRDPGRRFEFKARSAERDGWLVFRI